MQEIRPFLRLYMVDGGGWPLALAVGDHTTTGETPMSSRTLLLSPRGRHAPDPEPCPGLAPGRDRSAIHEPKTTLPARGQSPRRPDQREDPGTLPPTPQRRAQGDPRRRPGPHPAQLPRLRLGDSPEHGRREGNLVPPPSPDLHAAAGPGHRGGKPERSR